MLTIPQDQKATSEVVVHLCLQCIYYIYIYKSKYIHHIRVEMGRVLGDTVVVQYHSTTVPQYHSTKVQQDNTTGPRPKVGADESRQSLSVGVFIPEYPFPL